MIQGGNRESGVPIFSVLSAQRSSSQRPALSAPLLSAQCSVLPASQGYQSLLSTEASA
jgi:hypothetical protein